METIKKTYERPQSWAVAIGEAVMQQFSRPISPKEDPGTGSFGAPRYQGNDDWDE